MTIKKQRPAYFLTRHQVLDRETLNKIYVPKAVACLNNFDVEILIVNESIEVVGGQTGHTIGDPALSIPRGGRALVLFVRRSIHD